MSKNTQKSEQTSVTRKTGVHWDEVILPVLEALTPDTGFVHGEQSSFYQVKGPGGHRLYIAKGKPMVRRVDVGFDSGLPLQSRIPVRKANGSIVHELDVDHPDFLDDLKACLLYMGDPSTPPVQRKASTAFVPKMPVTAQLMPRGSAASRRALLEDTARRNGVSISAEAEEELRAMEAAERKEGPGLLSPAQLVAQGASSAPAPTPGPAISESTDWDAVASVLD